jgi:epoxyqueuosine reductase
MTQASDDGSRAGIRGRALALGFDAVGFADPGAVSVAGDRLAEFVERGWHGDMGWLADTLARRRSPTALWPDARSAVVVAVNYGPDLDPLATLAEPELATISVYARNRDYHNLIKGRLKQLAGWIHGKMGGEVKVFVDTAPLLEKPLAEAAGIGWQGKHTNLVARDAGSWLFLGVVLTTLDLAPDAAETDHCGHCRACLDVCPTKAFPAPYQLDARRCISYLTIEHKGHIPRDLRALMGNRIYGCDDCLAVCPWNKFAQPTDEPKLRARDDLTAPLLADLAGLDDAAFRKRFAGSPIKRIGRDRFLRNVLIAIGNSGKAPLSVHAERAVTDSSSLVRVAAIWALGRLLPSEEFQKLRTDLATTEPDPEVRAEWASL